MCFAGGGMTLSRSGWVLSLALAVMAGSPALADDHDAAAGGGRLLPGHVSATLEFAWDSVFCGFSRTSEDVAQQSRVDWANDQGA